MNAVVYTRKQHLKRENCLKGELTGGPVIASFISLGENTSY